MKTITLILAFLMIFGSAGANHNAGGELTYESVGNNIYKFTLTYYRNCNGIPEPAFFNMSITNGCNFPSEVAVLNHTSSPAIAVLPECPGILTVCDGGTSLGIQKIIYEGWYTLPYFCSSWYFSVSLIQRSAFVTTLINSSNTSVFVSAFLNNDPDLLNNSPTFKHNPLFIACVNQPYELDLAAIDADGDSLAYSLVAPLGDANTPVTYAAGYSISYPIVSNEPFEIDNSGKIYFTALQPEFTFFAVKVREFRNGNLIGEITRDVELHIVNCSGTPPVLSGLAGTVNSDTTICAYIPTCLNIAYAPSSNADSSYLSWDYGIPGSSLNPDLTINQTVNFCWTPTANDIGSTQCFTVQLTDNACPVFQTVKRKYCITVTDPLSANCSPTGNLSVDRALKNLIVYPQPSSGEFEIVLGDHYRNCKTLIIYDLAGRVVYRDNIESSQLNYDLSNRLSKGFYSIYIGDNEGKVIASAPLIIGE